MNVRVTIFLFLLLVPSVAIGYETSRKTLDLEIHDMPSEVMIDPYLLEELDSFRERNLAGLDTNPQVRVVLEFERELSPSVIDELGRKGVHFDRRGSAIVHVGRLYTTHIEDAEVLAELGRYGLQHVFSGSKQFYPSLSSSVPTLEAPAVWSMLDDSGSTINGSGVSVAVIDTGAAWLHPSFWRANSDEHSILEDSGNFYIDINDNSIADSNEGPLAAAQGTVSLLFDYSTDYLYTDVEDDGQFDFNEGDRWLGGIDANEDGSFNLSSEQAVILGESKIFCIYDQETGHVYKRGVNLTTQAPTVTDYHGHGSHVASTIAGGGPGLSSLTGVAPGADLIIIKSPLESADILDGIAFAIEQGADVINMSFSSYLGFLDGTDMEDLAITEAFLKHGVLSTVAAGNLGGRSKHAQFMVEEGSSVGASLSVSNPPDLSFINVLWQSKDRDEHVVLTPPISGDPIDLGPFSSLVDSAWQIDTDDLKAYAFAETSTRGMNRLIVQVSAAEHEWRNGIWTVSLSNPSGDIVAVDAYAWDNEWSGSHLRFSSHLSDLQTLSTPGTADLGICVTSYDEGADDVSFSSSRGPRIDGIALPTVTAPGTSVRAASRSLTSLWSTRSGTSMAAPHIAGVLALIIQSSGGGSIWRDYSALVEGAGENESHYSPPQTTWGHGLANSPLSALHALDRTTSIHRPMIDYLNVSLDGSTYTLDIAVSDASTPENQLSIGWQIIDGDGTLLDSGLQTGTSSSQVVIDTSSFQSNHIISILFNASNGVDSIYLPPIALSKGISVTLSILSAYLDQSSIRVGPFVSEQITGEIELEGYLNAANVYIGFESPAGFWLNFTLQGYQGIYAIELFPSNFMAGQYQVFAAATSTSGALTELLFATLTVVDDYTILMLVGVTALAVIVIVLAIPRIRRRGTIEV